jgi:hypothetical protein
MTEPGWRCWAVRASDIDRHVGAEFIRKGLSPRAAVIAAAAHCDLRTPIKHRPFEDALVSECIVHGDGNPQPKCVCGIYAVRRLEDLLGWPLMTLALAVAYVRLHPPVFESHLAGDPRGTIRGASAEILGPLYVRPDYLERMKTQTRHHPVQPVEPWPGGLTNVSAGWLFG